MPRTATEEAVLTEQDLSWNPLGTGTLSDSAILVHSQQTSQVVLGEGEVVIEPRDHAQHPLPNWVKPTVEVLAAKSQLAPNWDAYGGQPVKRGAVLYAIDILARSMSDNTAAPWVVATTDGGIQLE